MNEVSAGVATPSMRDLHPIGRADSLQSESSQSKREVGALERRIKRQSSRIVSYDLPGYDLKSEKCSSSMVDE